MPNDRLPPQNAEAEWRREAERALSEWMDSSELRCGCAWLEGDAVCDVCSLHAITCRLLGEESPNGE